MPANRSLRPGVVAIARNEGERLRRCLESLSGCTETVVYVDSGSTDGSREFARSTGAHVVELDLSLPFTAARARNAGFERLLQTAPATEFVQFIDGDCVLRAGWLDAAVGVLNEQRDVAVVCGRRRESAPQDSVYNRLCDVEWDTPVGDARACGGDALMRVDAFRQVGGFDAAMIAGEEPELCLRLARRGFRILRHDAEMTLHDAAMTHWTQWWKRALRTGHTTAELLVRYGNAPEHHRLRRALSALFWALLLPLAWLALLLWIAPSAGPLAVAVIGCSPALAYLLLLARTHRRCRDAGRSPADARAYAISCALAKWPELWGMSMYVGRLVTGRSARWIEYKHGPRGLANVSRTASTPNAAWKRGI